MLVLALLFPLASGGALPTIAQLFGVEGPHVCRCSAHGHDCLCARCFPDREDQKLQEESVKGRCGDDEAVFGGKALVAVLAAGFDVPRTVRVEERPQRAAPPPLRGADPPPPRPPRG